MTSLRVFAASVLASCALAGACATPEPLVRLAPDTAPIIWVGGRASVQQAQTGVRVATAFERQLGGLLALRLEIQNDTPDRIEVGPQDVSFALCQTAQTPSCAGSQRVIDPEQMLVSLDAAASRDAADTANEQVLLGTMVLLSAVGDVASAAGGHASRTTGLQTAAAAGAMEDSAAADAFARQSIASQRRLWSDRAFRRSTLFPGQGVDGLVLIPIDPHAGFVWLQASVARRTFAFHFAQTVTSLVPPHPPLSASSNR